MHQLVIKSFHHCLMHGVTMKFMTMDVKRAGCEDIELIHLAPDNNHFWALVNTMMEGCTNFPKTLTRSKSHTEDPQLLAVTVRSIVASSGVSGFGVQTHLRHPESLTKSNRIAN